MSGVQTIQAKIGDLISREGGYSSNPADAGGETCWGITGAVARAYGYEGPMMLLPMVTASDIYLQRYWLAPHLDQLDAISDPLASKLFDIGVNQGTAAGVRYLQRALNVLSDQGTRYPVLATDGGLGKLTFNSLRLFLAQRGAEGERVLVAMVRAQQCVDYMQIGEASPSQQQFEWGWEDARMML
jgi:lysozyme family protein